MGSKVTLKSKFQGALVGAVIGDCIGAYFEFNGRANIDAILQLTTKIHSKTVSDKWKNKTHQFTDDTAMARSIAQSLIERKTLDTRHLAKKFATAYLKEPRRGYGASVVTVFDKLNDSDQISDPFKPAAEQFDGSGSYGNGGAMRIMPAALYGFNNTLDEFNDLVTQITKITHSHLDGINGAILEACAVRQALKQEYPFSLNNKSKPCNVENTMDSANNPQNADHTNKQDSDERNIEVKSKSKDSIEVPMSVDCDTTQNSPGDSCETMENNAWKSTEKEFESISEYRDKFIIELLENMRMLEQEGRAKQISTSKDGEASQTSKDNYCHKLRTMKDYLKQEDIDQVDIQEHLGNDVSALHSVPAAVYSFLLGLESIHDIQVDNPFDRTMIYAISLDGDTDTIASMACGIAGALYGIEVIPKAYIDSCEGVQDAIEYADKLYEMVCEK